MNTKQYFKVITKNREFMQTQVPKSMLVIEPQYKPAF